MEQKYPACFVCDNIIDHPNQLCLLYLNFPRCFIITQSEDLYLDSFEEFVRKAKVNWLDPADKGTEAEQKEVLRTLWKFSIEQEAEEERLSEIYGY